MKKAVISMFAVATLAGCGGYDYYKGDVRYTQDGNDCVYRAEEYADRFTETIEGMDSDKRIVYKNTRCADLFARDNGARLTRNERQALVPVSVEQPVAATNCCGCKAEPISRRFYTISGK